MSIVEGRPQCRVSLLGRAEGLARNLTILPEHHGQGAHHSRSLGRMGFHDLNSGNLVSARPRRRDFSGTVSDPFGLQFSAWPILCPNS